MPPINVFPYFLDDGWEPLVTSPQTSVMTLGVETGEAHNVVAFAVDNVGNSDPVAALTDPTVQLVLEPEGKMGSFVDLILSTFSW